MNRCCFPVRDPRIEGDMRYGSSIEITGKSGQLPEHADINIATHHQESKNKGFTEGAGKGNKITEGSAKVEDAM